MSAVIDFMLVPMPWLTLTHVFSRRFPDESLATPYTIVTFLPRPMTVVLEVLVPTRTAPDFITIVELNGP